MQEIGRIVHTNRELPPVPHRQAGADAGGGFHGGGVDTAVHHTPWRVVIRPEVDVPGHAGSTGRIHNEAGCGDEPAGSLSAEIDTGVRAGLGTVSVLHDTVVAEAMARPRWAGLPITGANQLAYATVPRG